MFKLCWDKENNGITLADAIPENEQIQPVRPVFYEELDLLGLISSSIILEMNFLFFGLLIEIIIIKEN